MFVDLLLQSSYFLSAFLFILALGGLSHQESARKGNYYGIFAMTLAILVTFLTESFYGIDFAKFGVGFGPGGVIGLIMALKVKFILIWIYIYIFVIFIIFLYKYFQVEMTFMPQMVAILHSFVGIAATIVGYASFLKEVKQTKIFLK